MEKDEKGKLEELSGYAQELARRYASCELRREEIVNGAMFRIIESFKRDAPIEEMKCIIRKEAENTYRREKRKNENKARYGYVEGPSLDEVLSVDDYGHEITLKDLLRFGVKDREDGDFASEFKYILFKMSFFERQIVNCYAENLKTGKPPKKRKLLINLCVT